MKRDLVSQHPVLAALAVTWYTVAVSGATLMVFVNMAAVNMAVATCYSALVGIPATCATVYQWKMRVNVVTGDGTYHDHSTEENES